jgi:hypothetical protein
LSWSSFWLKLRCCFCSVVHTFKGQCGSLPLWKFPAQQEYSPCHQGSTPVPTTNFVALKGTHTCMHTGSRHRSVAPMVLPGDPKPIGPALRQSKSMQRTDHKQRGPSSEVHSHRGRSQVRVCQVLLRAAPAEKSPAQLSQLLPPRNAQFLCMCPSPTHGLWNLQLISNNLVHTLHLLLLLLTKGRTDGRTAGCCRCCTRFPAAPADTQLSQDD